MSGTISRFGSVVPKDLHRSVQQIIYNLGGADKDEVVLRDGTQNLTGNLQCNGKRLVNIGAPVSASDATTKSAVDAVQTSADNALTQANIRVLKSGDTLTGNLAMSGNKITGLSAGTSNGDSVRFEELQAVSGIATNAQTSADNADTNANSRLLKSGDTLTGNLNMSGNLITGLPVATSNGEAVEFSQLQTAVNDKAPTTEGVAEANKNLVCDSNTSITGLASLGVAGCNLTEVAGSGGADYELKLYNDSITNSGTTTGLSPVVHQGASRNTAVTSANNWYPADANVWQLANSEVPITAPHYEMLDFNLKASGIGLNRNFPLKRPNQSKVLFTTGTSYHGGTDTLLHLTGTETINSGVQLVGFDCRNMEAYVSFQSHSYSFWTQFLSDNQPFEIGGADFNNFNQLAAVYISISRNSFKFRIGGTSVQEYTAVDPIGTLGDWTHWAVSNDRSNGNVSNVTIFRNGSIYATFTDPGWNFDAGAFDSPIIFGNMHPEMKIAGIRAWRGTTIDANFIATLWNERHNTGIYDLTVNGSLVLPPLEDIGTIDPNDSVWAVETWVKDTGVAGIETLFAWHEDPFYHDDELTEIRIDRTNPGTPILALRKYNTGGTSAPPTYQYTSAGNGWDHIVVSFSGGTCYFYVNNQTAHTFSWADSNHHGGRFRVGSRPLTALAPTHSTAQIGRVLMFNSHLTASQVSDLYAHRLMTTPGFRVVASLAPDSNSRAPSQASPWPADDRPCSTRCS